MTQPDRNHLEFFLGGHDLEMLTIRELLLAAQGRFHDAGLAWGARTSAYAQAIHAALKQGRVPVLVELPDDLELPPERVIAVDHHGPLAGADRPTALHQVFDLLQLPPERWTRHLTLVAANDTGYLPALAAAGASREEIVAIRRADRAAQGVTEADERAAEAALPHLTPCCDGQLTLGRLATDRTAPLVDRLQPELGGPGFTNLLLLCPNEVDFFGAGPLVTALSHAFPAGWYGGALPERGFWGHPAPYPEEAIRALLEDRLTQR